MKEEQTTITMAHIDKRNQLRTTYQDSITFQGRQLISQMTPESLQHFADIIQARITFGGETVANQELYKEVKKKLSSKKAANGNT